MDCSRLFQLHKDGEKAEFAGSCHDCGRGVKVASQKAPEGKLRIEGGAVYETREGLFFKCDECFNREKTLKNHRECEVYSRIVGYLRPISQWNTGKLSEYDKRTMLRFQAVEQMEI